ncbi:MAG: flagellar M-ring protein FliF [Melioribacteraceae bacterium]|nr:flagellar M-ring protein FliF [Melioribacteraceae bacterium]MCF8353735.1 flagellar M-ring protein FliF [Melioribacteraceae bacterium]MCF8392456.1 flagellar M-ring protein FliF [Melioribacteraceae bacterium]MCF8418367.1 flagellar M-ring protein FliF [Melioribacteraceae bacterium]
MLKKLSVQQKILVGIVFITTIIMLAFVLFLFNEPNYQRLYSSLTPDDAAKVLEELSAQKIPYKIDDDGRTIKVPAEKVYELRLKMAGKGIPNSGIIGYEIFDKNTLGMSDFMQKLNFKRALEGELSRTIAEQNGVQSARVQIVIPEKSIFKDEHKPTTASVVLKLHSRNALVDENIYAITHLVASSVEGLEPEKVTILDTQGRLLTKEEEDNTLAEVSGKQYEIKGKIENYLSSKAQSILDNILGYGNAIVKVNVDLDFTQIDKTMERYDPDSQVAISEQTVTTESTGRSMSDSNAVISQNSVTNYELSKSIERVIEGSGNIKRITVAAVVNGIPKEIKTKDKTETVIEPRSEQQLQQLEQLVRRAIGINDGRKDEISIISFPFENNQFEGMEETTVENVDFIKEYSNYILFVLAAIAALFVLKSLMTKLKNEKIIIGTVDNGNSYEDLASVSAGNSSLSRSMRIPGNKKKLLEVGDIEEEISDEAHEKKVKQEKIVNYVAKNPTDAARLINSWLREDEY